ncbi:unnamed protein product [Miscanthus lutarioriparius]|uniref:DUF668 domain-containing protein n=1 Tax=Miscanthus lutarioriparius TaxID=422564 RepID=A0A811QET7_9POAL|nr:unnamed protein product [Miscanthus lutarioriparius]
MKHLKEVVFSYEGIRSLISEDYSQLLGIVETDIREDLSKFSTEVARFGNRCQDPRRHCLDRVSTDTWGKLGRNSGFRHSLSDKACAAHFEQICISVKNQRNTVKKLKRKSLWSKTMEEVVDKLVEFVYFLQLEISTAFLNKQGYQSVNQASSTQQMLGPSGLAFQYAKVILHINTLAFPSYVGVNGTARDALYQALPPCIKWRLRQRPCIAKTVGEARAEIDKILQWLVPVAESTRLYYKNGTIRESELKGTEDVDVDEAENHQITVSTMLAHENDTVIKINTLYYANKEKADGYVLHLLWALQDYIDAISMAYRRPMVHG